MPTTKYVQGWHYETDVERYRAIAHAVHAGRAAVAVLDLHGDVIRATASITIDEEPEGEQWFATDDLVLSDLDDRLVYWMALDVPELGIRLRWPSNLCGIEAHGPAHGHTPQHADTAIVRVHVGVSAEPSHRFPEVVALGG